MASLAEDRLAALKQQIYDLEHQIYVLEFPPRDRGELRQLRRALAALEAETGGPTADSPTLRKGRGPRDAFGTGTHDAPWFDPPAVQSVAELKAFHGRMATDSPDSTFVATATMPGVDVAVTYVDGQLEQAIVRGDGRQGDDITDNIRTLPSVPIRLRSPGTQTDSRVTKPTGQGFGPSTATPVPAYPSRLQVRLTVALRNVDLTALDRRRVDAGDPPYVLPRGAAMSCLRRLDSRITAVRRLRAFATGCATPPPGIDSQWQLLGALKSWGFAVQAITWRCRGLQEVLDFVAALQQQAPTYDYPLEGGRLIANRIGAGTPNLEARLSFPPPGRPAVVNRVYHAVGRGGAILPVALVAPAPEHKLPVPERAPVPAIGQAVSPLSTGTEIRVRPGPVAPIITLADEGAPLTAAPLTACPACRGPLESPRDEPFVRCVSLACIGRARARLLHLVGPRGLRLAPMNVKAVDRLIAELGPLDVPSFFALDEEAIQRFAPGHSATILEALGDARRMPLWRFLYLSAIAYVCEHEARALVRHVQTVDRLRLLTSSDLDRIDGLSPQAARSLAAWLESEGRVALSRATEVGLTLLGDDEAFSAPFLGKTVVVAGELEWGAAQVADEIERRGGIIQADVGRDTDLVVVGTSAQKTFDTAVMYGVPVIEEAAVNDVLRRTGPQSEPPNEPT